MPGQCRRSGSKVCGRQAIADDDDLRFPNALFNEPVRSRPGIAHHPVAPSKCSQLSTRLGGREKITQLPLATNHDRNARQTCSGNKREVRVEVKGMSD